MQNIINKINGKVFKLEKDFVSAFLKENKENGGWSYKLNDIVRTIKPFDCIFINQNGFFVCEAKMIDNDIFEISQLRSNQFTALERIYLLIEKYNLKSIYSVVLIYSIKEKKMKILNFGEILKYFNNGINKIKIDF